MTNLGKSLLVAGGIGAVTLGATFANGAPAIVQGMKPLLVRDFNAPAVRPFQVELCNENNADVCGDRGSSLTVPIATASEELVTRFVIEYVSARCGIFPATAFVSNISLRTTASGMPQVHSFIPVVIPLADLVVVAQDTRVYADPGSELDLLAGVTAEANWCVMSISGHLVVE